MELLLFLFVQFLDTVGANQFPFEHAYFSGVSAKDTGGVILFQNNFVFLHKNFNRVVNRNIHGSSQFDWQYNASKLIKLSDNAGGFHNVGLP